MYNTTDLVLIRAAHTTEEDLTSVIPRILVSPHHFPIEIRTGFVYCNVCVRGGRSIIVWIDTYLCLQLGL